MDINSQFTKITTFIFDVDGVLTDGSVLVLENGLQARRMNIRDGYALQLAIKKGYRILVISGAATSPVIDRLNKLGITEVYMGAHDKRGIVEKYAAENNLRKEELLFMGDDMPDYEVMKAVGMPVCPADAIEVIKELSLYIASLKGGEGCVREVVEKVMKLRGDWLHIDTVASR